MSNNIENGSVFDGMDNMIANILGISFDEISKLNDMVKGSEDSNIEATIDEALNTIDKVEIVSRLTTLQYDITNIILDINEMKTHKINKKILKIARKFAETLYQVKSISTRKPDLYDYILPTIVIITSGIDTIGNIARSRFLMEELNKTSDIANNIKEKHKKDIGNIAFDIGNISFDDELKRKIMATQLKSKPITSTDFIQLTDELKRSYFDDSGKIVIPEGAEFIEAK